MGIIIKNPKNGEKTMFISKKRAKLLGLIMIPYLYGMKPTAIRASQKRGTGSQIMVLGADGEPTTPTPRPAFKGLTVAINANAAAPHEKSPNSAEAKSAAEERRRVENVGTARPGAAFRPIPVKRSRSQSHHQPSPNMSARTEPTVFAGARDFTGNPQLSPSRQAAHDLAGKKSEFPKPGSQLSAANMPHVDNEEIGFGEIIDMMTPDNCTTEQVNNLEDIKKRTITLLQNNEIVKGMALKLKKSPAEIAKAYFEIAYAKYAKQQDTKIDTTAINAQAEKIWQEIVSTLPRQSPQTVVRHTAARTPSPIATVASIKSSAGYTNSDSQRSITMLHHAII